MGQKPKVAFVCVHNPCRSQIAEAFGKLLASDVKADGGKGHALYEYEELLYGQ